MLTIKKFALTTMVVALLWLFLISVVNINTHGFVSTSDTSSQSSCVILPSDCEDLIPLENRNFDITTKFLSYSMIAFGISLLIINWRVSRLEDN